MQPPLLSFQTVPLPDLGAAVPRTGNAVSQWLGRAVMRLLGWRFTGNLPDLPQFVIIAAPHTSNWDGIVALAAKLALGLEARFFAKHSLFVGPTGWLLARMGGIPIRRDMPGGIAEQAVDWFSENPEFVLGITPEGTRKQTERWKTGFYRIAEAARVPIVCVMFDYANKRIGPGPVIYPTGKRDMDLAEIQAFYQTVRGKHARQGS